MAMMSIVIPAHNEAEVIDRALGAITRDARPDELRIVVVCNGCSDNTAKIAREYERMVQVVESPIANKAEALNLGDSVLGAQFPRFYVDADVSIGLDGLRHLAGRLEAGGLLAVAPLPEIDASRCAWPVRWFCQIAALLPSAKEGIGGSGVYGLSRAGRERFADFPKLIADDAFIQLLFNDRERETSVAVRSLVHPPRRLRDLIRVRIRIRLGHLELADALPENWRQRRGNEPALLGLFKNPALWPKLLLYCSVICIARCRALRRYRTRSRRWERDDRSRRDTQHARPSQKFV